MHSNDNEKSKILKNKHQIDENIIDDQQNCREFLKRKCPTNPFFDHFIDGYPLSKSYKKSNIPFSCDDAKSPIIHDGNGDMQIFYNAKYFNDVNCETTVEYVNIMFDNDLLPIEQNLVNYNSVGNNSCTNNCSGVEDIHSSWNTVNLLDLDQENNYYYEQTTNLTIKNKDINCEILQDNSSTNTIQVTENIDDLKPSNQEDSDDKNLSWLYNYKLDDLPHLSPEVNNPCRSDTGLRVDKIIQEATSSEIEEYDIVSENQPIVLENNNKMPKKPPFTYTELIEYALEDKGELTVSGIYQWISDRFPFYKSNDDRWKNSVRHNLSINPHFRKGNKAAQGAGHLWTISTRDSEANVLAWEHKKQRFDLFFKIEKNICQQNNLLKLSPAQMSQGQLVKKTTSEDPALVTNIQLYDEAEIAAANLTSILEKQPFISPERDYSNNLPNSYEQLDSNNSDDLKRTAGEILNGVRRTVEVQVINPNSMSNYPNSTTLETDYLNPVPKEQIVRESGLRSNAKNDLMMINDFYVTEIDPNELGVNMNREEGDEEILFGDDFNLNYFGVIAGNNLMA